MTSLRPPFRAATAAYQRHHTGDRQQHRIAAQQGVGHPELLAEQLRDLQQQPSTGQVGQAPLDAAELCRSDPEWIAPLIWRSELRNVLVTSLRHRWLELAAAQAIEAAADELFSGREVAVDSAEVLRLAAESGCSAYDCESSC